MRHIAAYALLVLGGNASPSAADVKKVIKEAGATADDSQVDALVAACNGKAFHELVEAGMSSIASSGPAAGAAAAGGAPAAAAKEAVVEAEPEEEVDMGGLFGDDDDDY